MKNCKNGHPPYEGRECGPCVDEELAADDSTYTDEMQAEYDAMYPPLYDTQMEQR